MFDCLDSGSRLQPLRGDPDNPHPQGTNAIAQARTGSTREKKLIITPVVVVGCTATAATIAAADPRIDQYHKPRASFLIPS